MASNEMNLQQYMEILRSRARFIIGIFVLGIAIAGIVTYLTPKKYTAFTSLSFELQGENPFADARGLSMRNGMTYIATQMDIIRSVNVAQKVVDSLTQNEKDHLIASLEADYSKIEKMRDAIFGPIRSLFRGDIDRVPEGKADGSDDLQIPSPYNWVAQSLGKNLIVKPMFGSNIVTISYASTNPKIAALIANKFAEAYIVANLQMIINPAQKTKVWFNEQLKSLRDNLQNAQSQLTAYQQKEGIVATDERIDTESRRLQELSSQLVAAQQETRNAVTQQQQLKEVLAGSASLMTFPKVFTNPVIQTIKTDIRTLEGRLVELSSRLGENHPAYKRVREELKAAHGRLDREIKLIAEGINNDAELAKGRTRDLAKELEAQKQLVLDLKYEYGRIAILAREVESDQATYNTALDELNQASMRSMVNQTNISIVDPASVPRVHSSPRVMTNLVLGGLGGLLIGVGVTIFMSILVRRVHSKEDIIVEVGVPLLGQLKKA
jgi:chain length determinant protein EpsF